MSQPAVELHRPTAEHLDHLAQHLRAQDIAEIHAGGRHDVRAALEQSVAVSRWAWVVTVDGEVACVFGLAERGSLIAPIGVPWMLGTELVSRHRRVLQRTAPRYIEAMLQEYPRLYNAVHAENTVAVRWLKRLGFTLHPATAAPATGAPFHLFEMTRHV